MGQGMGQGRDQVVQARLLASRAKVARGGVYALAVVLRVAPGFHINAARPTDPNLIPTRVEFSAAPGLEVGGVSYPPAHMAELAFADQPVKVYDGEVVIRADLAVAPEAPLGRAPLRARLSFQGCDNHMCMMPQTRELALELEVAPAGGEGPALHPGVFAD
jgi:hypothetical protein